jgi:hypothetical protein
MVRRRGWLTGVVIEVRSQLAANLPPSRPDQYVSLCTLKIAGTVSVSPAVRAYVVSMDIEYTMVAITVGSLAFRARLEALAAPETCAAFNKLLPLKTRLLQARWSGEAAWAELAFGGRLPAENAMDHPKPGQLLFYPGGISAPEILFPYGRTRFACRDGSLQGNHFLTVVDGLDQLPALGELIARKGAQNLSFDTPVKPGEIARIPLQVTIQEQR